MGIFNTTNLEGKTEIYFVTAHIILHCLQTLHIVTTRRIKILTQKLLSLYHIVLILLYKPNAAVLQMPLRAQIIHHKTDYIKAPTIMIIFMEKITTIHSHMRHLKKIRSSSFGDTIATTTTP